MFVILPNHSPPGHWAFRVDTVVHSISLAIFGFFTTFGLALVAIRALAKHGWLDHPGARKEHSGPIPRTGGIALWLAVCLGQATGWIKLPIEPSEWVCLHSLALLGALDDRFNLRSRVKALAGFGLALTLAIPVAHAFAMDRPEAVLMAIRIPLTPPYLAIGLLTLWFWAVPQTFNLIDGMNGLAIGTSLIALLAVQLDIRAGQGAYLLGAVLAVFILNWPKAFHFLGDCGAYFLGGLLALVALKTKAFLYPSHALWIFAYPILDTLQVIIIRLVTHRPLGMGDRNHLHHHLARILGRHAAWTVPLLWVQMIALAARPMYFPSSGPIAWTVLILMLIQVIAFIRWAHVQACRNTSPD